MPRHTFDLPLRFSGSVSQKHCFVCAFEVSGDEQIPRFSVGHNFDGPKVAKFLVESFSTCMIPLTIESLSPPVWT